MNFQDRSAKGSEGGLRVTARQAMKVGASREQSNLFELPRPFQGLLRRSTTYKCMPLQILFQTPHPPNFVFFVSLLNAYLWGKEEETAPQRGFIFHFQALTAIRTAPAGLIPVASGLMRVRFFLMISFREGLLACFFTSSASAQMVFQLFSNFFVILNPTFEHTIGGAVEQNGKKCVFGRPERAAIYG